MNSNNSSERSEAVPNTSRDISESVNTPSNVIHIRLSAKDTMAVVDTLRVLGIPLDNLSLGQATKLALTALLESQRETGTIPTRGIGEYEIVTEAFNKPNFSGMANRLKPAKTLTQPS